MARAILHPVFQTVRRLYERGPANRGVAVDVDGATLGPDCSLVRRTPTGYRGLARSEAAAIQALLFGREEDPDWLFRQCGRIARALSDENVALAQIYGMSIPVAELDRPQIAKLSGIAKANFSPDQPRDAHGRWTDEGAPAASRPPELTPSIHPFSSSALPKPVSADLAETQLAADNQRENKMVADIVVRLRLSKDQRQELHREISGQGLTYQEILQLAKDMFNK
jgi:hypothetical protein